MHIITRHDPQSQPDSDRCEPDEWERLALGAAEARENAELDVTAAILADPSPLFLEAARQGFKPDRLGRDECRIVLATIADLIGSGQLGRGLEPDRVAAYDRVCRRIQSVAPATWMPAPWAASWSLSQQCRQLRRSRTWSPALVRRLFDLHKPSIETILFWVRRLDDLAARERVARQHYDAAAALLRGDDRSSINCVLPRPRSMNVAGVI